MRQISESGRILRVSRIIAGLAGVAEIRSDHLSEAIQHRRPDKQLRRKVPVPE